MTLLQTLLFGLRWQQTFMRRRVAGWFFRIRCLAGGAYVAGGAQVAGGSRITVESGVVIHSRAFLFTRDGGAIVIGANSRIGSDATIGAAGHVHIGKGVLIAARCMIADYSHEFSNGEQPVMDQGASRAQPVRIGDGSWLGINACILPGVSLGDNCVVGANSVVTKSFEDGSVVGGVPAKLLKTLSTSTPPQPR